MQFDRSRDSEPALAPNSQAIPAAARPGFVASAQMSLPCVSPLNQQLQQQRVQRQVRQCTANNQSPGVGLQPSPSCRSPNAKLMHSDDEGHNHNHNAAPRPPPTPPQAPTPPAAAAVQTFIPDPTSYDDSPPPPAPCQSSTITQVQLDYLDKLITDCVIFGVLYMTTLSYKCKNYLILTLRCINTGYHPFNMVDAF